MNGEYAVQAMAIDTSENIAHLVPPEAEPLTFRVEEEVELESVMNAPNPFSDTTAFSYSLTQAADKVTIKIYTLRGRLVRTLEQNLPRWQYNEEFWDGRDEEGNKLASGTYFYRFTVNSGDKKIEKIGKLAIIR
jgi:flagellar hook assembly protein FlgD